MAKAIKLKKFTISRIANLTKGSQRDDDDEQLGCLLYMTKGENLQINEDLIFKDLEKEINLKDGESFDINVIPEVIKGEVGLSEDLKSLKYIISDNSIYQEIYECKPHGENGVSFIKGLRDGSTELHSIIFNKPTFDKTKATQWLNANLRINSNLQKGDNPNSMELQDILPEITKSQEKILEKGLEPINELKKEFQSFKEEVNLRLTKMEKPIETTPPIDQGKIDLEKKEKELNDKIAEFTSLASTIQNLEKGQKDISDKISAIESTGLISAGAFGVPGFAGSLNKPGVGIKAENGMVITKADEGNELGPLNLKLSKGEVN